MKESVRRFSNRVENYVKYRPGYPPAVLSLFEGRMGLTSDSVVADIGSGPGISCRLFLENGNPVYGVEPNADMREAAGRLLGNLPNFHNWNGTAENTGLPDASVDFIIAAQAFHWFEPEATQREFRRILKPGGWIALIWNERQLDSTDFLREYESFLLRYANDYEQVRHENITEPVLEKFFGASFRRGAFPNVQILDFEGLRGRLLSSSYMPAEDDPAYIPMIAELTKLFAKHEESGKIKVFYDTNVFYCQP